MANNYFKKSLRIALKDGWKREQAEAYEALGQHDKAIKIFKGIGMKK